MTQNRMMNSIRAATGQSWVSDKACVQRGYGPHQVGDSGWYSPFSGLSVAMGKRGFWDRVCVVCLAFLKPSFSPGVCNSLRS